MKLPVDGIEAFIQVAELASFQKAAERIGLTQTALTRRIQKLEGHVGLRLIDRTTRFIELTAVGRDFLPQARRLMEDLAGGLDRLRRMSRTSAGDVTLACLSSLTYHQLPPALCTYARRYPQNRVQILERTGGLVTEAVRQGQAEFGIHILGPSYADLVDEPLLRDPFVLFCAKEHPLSGLKRASWKTLRGVDLITLGGASGHRRLIEEQLARVGLDVRGRFVVENFASAVALAATGVGVAILPASLRITASQPNMRQIPLVDPVIHRSIGLTRRRGVTLTPAAQALYDHLKRALAERSRAGRAVAVLTAR